jgi:hypothetical protein
VPSGILRLTTRSMMERARRSALHGTAPIGVTPRVCAPMNSSITCRRLRALSFPMNICYTR